jgi:2-C-methyl-D-erythritol 4-phosphate cytidylyltransferase
MSTTAIILAAGRSLRCPGAVPKQLRRLGGMPVLARCARTFDACPLIDDIVLVVSEEHIPFVNESIVTILGIRKAKSIVEGGRTRRLSLEEAFKALPDDCDTVVIHDSARPLVSGDLIVRVINTCEAEAAVMPALKAEGAVKRIEGGLVLASLDQDRIYTSQTPQAFKRHIIEDSYRRLAKDDREYPDDSAVVEAAGYKVSAVEGEPSNIQIVYPRDLEYARILLTVSQEESYG